MSDADGSDAHGGNGAPTDKSGREVELKLRVDDLASLMKIATASGGKPEPTVLQLNAFFDTPDRALGTRGLVVRLREERLAGRSRWFVTTKGPGQRSGNMTDVVEEEIEVDQVRAMAIKNGADPVAALEGGNAHRQQIVNAIRGTLKGRALAMIGQFKNERTRIKARLSTSAGESFDAVLELDRTMFPGDQVHHEVEMEVPAGVDPDVATRALEELFVKAGVVGRGAPGKARRFFAAVRGERLE